MLVTRDTGIDRVPAFETLTVDYKTDANAVPLPCAKTTAQGSLGRGASAWERLPGTDLTSSRKQQQDFAKGSILQAK